MSAQAELAFVKDFQKKTMDYLETFCEIERRMEGEQDRWNRLAGLSEEEKQKLVARFISQQQATVKAYDRAVALAEKYGIHEEFYSVIKSQPGNADSEGTMYVGDGRFLRNINDTFVRLIAAIENAPPEPSKIATAINGAWKWLDDRGIAKWMVGIGILLIALWVLKKLGYDMTTLIELVKAVRG